MKPKRPRKHGILTSPLISALSGKLGGPNAQRVIRTWRLHHLVLTEPKRLGGDAVETDTWKFTQYAWRALDPAWMSLTQADKLLWSKHARSTSPIPRSGFDYWRNVNIRRLLLGFPPIARPPDPSRSIKRLAVKGPDFPNLPEGKGLATWQTGYTYPSHDPTYFDEETGLQWDQPPCPPPAPYPSYTIVATSSPYGDLDPEGTFVRGVGDSMTFTAIPDPAATHEQTTVDGQPLGPVSPYTFPWIRNDHTIHATFDLHCQDTYSDDFNRPDADTLGEYWLQAPPPLQQLTIHNNAAAIQYDPAFGNPQSKTAVFHRYNCAQQAQVTAPWTGRNYVQTTATARAHLNLVIGFDDELSNRDRYIMAVVDSDSPDNCKVRLRRVKLGVNTLLATSPPLGNNAAQWTFKIEGNDATGYTLTALKNAATVLTTTDNQISPGQHVGFNLRIQAIGGPLTGGYAAIAQLDVSPP